MTKERTRHMVKEKTGPVTRTEQDKKLESL